MKASQALDHIRRHGTPRDVQTALYYVTRGRTAHLLELAHAVTPAQASVVERPSPSDATPARITIAAPTIAAPMTVELPV